MPAASVANPASATLYGQLQQQQAQRTADQAEVRARALQGQAREAQGAADRAAEEARSLKSRSQQARGAADDAQRNLVALDALSETRRGLAALQSEVQGAIATLDTAASTGSPVLNLYGQETGTQVNVTA